jgi:hypothetical protein
VYGSLTIIALPIYAAGIFGWIVERDSQASKAHEFAGIGSSVVANCPNRARMKQSHITAVTTVLLEILTG